MDTSDGKAFPDDAELAKESRRIVESQKMALSRWEDILLGSSHVFAEWTKFNRQFLARASGRLEMALNEDSYLEQKEKVGQVATENVRDYFESFNKFAHEASVISARFARRDMESSLFTKAKENQADSSHAMYGKDAASPFNTMPDPTEGRTSS